MAIIKQGSIDHRGIPENPGRVVTLIPSEKDYVWGVCYEVSEENIEKTLQYLDHREKGGYARDSVIVYKNTEDTLPLLENVLVYTATETNPDYLGELDEYLIAKQILSCHGPSGSNLEYFMRLSMCLREHNVIDEHICSIEKYIIQIQKELNQSEEETKENNLLEGIKIKI